MSNFDISIVVPGMAFDHNTVETASLGGSETAGYYMAKSLAALGHKVILFCNCTEEGVFDDVMYRKMEHARSYMSSVPHDICIVQRAPELFALKTAARINILWQHDLALKRVESNVKGALWNVDRILVVSEFHKKQYQEVYELPDEMFIVTRNGIDTALFQKEPQVRDKKRLVYAARPERGLDNLLINVYPKLIEKDPEFKLDIYGYDNPVDHMESFYASLHALGAQLPNVTFHPPKTKQELVKAYESSGVYVYPTPSPTQPMFDEVSCITAMECMGSGLPIVTSNRGALPETITKGAGVLVDGDPNTEAYLDKFIDAVYKLTRDGNEQWGKMSDKGIVHSLSLDWEHVAQQWTDEFETVFNSLNDNDERLARHFFRQSDIMAIKHMMEKRGYEPSNFIKAHLDHHYGFVDAEDGFKKQYEAIGETHDKRVFESVQYETRFQHLLGWLKENEDANKIIDYGCAHGSYSIHLSNALPDHRITGVDIDHNSVRIANEFVQEGKAKHPDNLLFKVDTDFKPDDQGNCLLMQEILEHVKCPWEFVDDKEKFIEDDGWVYITVPIGPWEYDSYHAYPYRCHIWHFDAHDLRDMFGKKKDIQLGQLIYQASPSLADPLGWWIVMYRKDGTPTGKINMDRKCELQRPRQTVSASIMAGPGSEQQMDWTLNSIKDIVDEVSIADCGMSSFAMDIAKKYSVMFDVHVTSAPDPKVEGFETPRNISLDRCSMDWVLWIDTDEAIVDPQYVQKYLRENMFNAYSVAQHHFAVDTVFNPDMPARFFRNREVDGNKMRFYGMVHEHPELGLNKGPGTAIALIDVNIAHTGYLSERIRRARFERNFPRLQMDVEKYPERLLQKHLVMRDNMLLTQYELQQNGGVLNDNIRARCEETVRLYQEHFLGKNTKMSNDAIQWYSTALQILGRGFEATCDFGINGEVQPRKYFYASKEDFEKDFKERLEDKMRDREHRYY